MVEKGALNFNDIGRSYRKREKMEVDRRFMEEMTLVDGKDEMEQIRMGF